MLRILGRASSINVRKVLWTCAEIGLPFEREDWGIGFQPTSDPSFTALNPNALVRVVMDGDFVLWESNTICRWLAAEHGRSDVLPRGPRPRALVECWMDWQLGELNNAWRYAFMALVRQSPAHRDPAAVAASVAEWNRLMALLDAHLRHSGPQVGGADFTLADIVLGLAVHRSRSTPIEHTALPAVDRYFDLLAARPAWHAADCGGHP